MIKRLKKARHIGIDFDNTIVTYDKVFYKYALKTGLIYPGIPEEKQSIRDAIRLLRGGNDKWTELQGVVYGIYMEEAEPVKGVENFLRECKKNSLKISIISHKTLYPALGPRVNLQEAAKRWLANRDFLAKFGLTGSDVVFEASLRAKLGRIRNRGCDYFIDDLEEVLVHPDFPDGVTKILYGRHDGNGTAKDIVKFEEWREIKNYFFG